MNISVITNRLAERFPETAELLQVNSTMPHTSYLINTLLNLYVTRVDSRDRKLADLQIAVSKGSALTSSLEDVLFADVAVAVVERMIVCLEHGLAQKDDVAVIEKNLKEWAFRWAMNTDLPRSSSMVENARSVMELDAWRSIAREMRLS